MGVTADQLVEDWGPVRQVAQGIRVMRGLVCSSKSDRLLQAEGRLEYDWLQLWEVDREVVRIFDQPLTIRYASHPQTGAIVLLTRRDKTPKGYIRSKYTPDFLLVTRSGGHDLVQSKMERNASSEKVRRACRAGELCAQAMGRGWSHRLVTDSIRRTVRFANAKIVVRYRADVLPPGWEDRVLSLLSGGSLSMAAIARRTGVEKGLAFGWCCTLICRGVLVIDWDKPITPATRVAIGDDIS